MKSARFLTVLVAVLCLSACHPSTPVAENTPQTNVDSPATAQPGEPPSTAEPVAATLQPLPAAPRETTFTTPSGDMFHGWYYPAAQNPAPVVVLMHWSNGDMSDWYEVAVWLQNRGQPNPFSLPDVGEMYVPWWEASWFPTLPADLSYGVLIFSFSNSLAFPHEPLAEIDTSSWLEEAQAAML